VLEVKGGALRYDASDGIWYSTPRGGAKAGKE